MYLWGTGFDCRRYRNTFPDLYFSQKCECGNYHWHSVYRYYWVVRVLSEKWNDAASNRKEADKHYEAETIDVSLGMSG